MELRGIFTRNTNATPEEKLFRAVAQVNFRKVQKLLAEGANANIQNNSNKTPLDVCAEKIESRLGSGFYLDVLEVKEASLIWGELIKAGGTLNKYKDDSRFVNGKIVKFSGKPFAILAKPHRP